MLKAIISIVISMLLAFACAFVGVPFAIAGLAGIVGQLFDTSYAENLQMGLRCLAIFVIVLGTSLTWFWWYSCHDLPTRFSMRQLMFAITTVSVLGGLLASLSSR